MESGTIDRHSLQAPRHGLYLIPGQNAGSPRHRFPAGIARRRARLKVVGAEEPIKKGPDVINVAISGISGFFLCLIVTILLVTHVSAAGNPANAKSAAFPTLGDVRVTRVAQGSPAAHRRFMTTTSPKGASTAG